MAFVFRCSVQNTHSPKERYKMINTHVAHLGANKDPSKSHHGYHGTSPDAVTDLTLPLLAVLPLPLVLELT